MSISKVVHSGRTFVRRLIELSKRAKYLHHQLERLTRYQVVVSGGLPTWNGISAFMDDFWTPSVDLQMFTDASDVALAGYVNGEWCIEAGRSRRCAYTEDSDGSGDEGQCSLYWCAICQYHICCKCVESDGHNRHKWILMRRSMEEYDQLF